MIKKLNEVKRLCKSLLFNSGFHLKTNCQHQNFALKKKELKKLLSVLFNLYKVIFHIHISHSLTEINP